MTTIGGRNRSSMLSCWKRGMTTHLKTEDKNIWFHKTGLSFKCTSCGACCTGKRGRVYLNDKEEDRIADHLDMELKTFQKKHVIKEGNSKVSLLRSISDHCGLWDPSSKKCSVYEARPTQCKTYPFWPQHVITPYDWKVAAIECEGIDHQQKRVTASEPSSSATIPVIPSSTVMENVVIHGVYNSGNENLTFEEMNEYITTIDRSLLDEFEANIVTKYTRTPVYSDDMILVQDNALGELYTRSLHFQSSLNVTQSEVFLTNEGEINHEAMVLEVHRALCLPIGLGWRPPPTSVAVLGTGAGALPSFLHFHCPNVYLDCVDISPQVLNAATTYFGLQESSRLKLLEMPGEDYVSTVSLLDLVFVDVATSSLPIFAPPESLISTSFLLKMRQQMQDGGMIVWNMIPATQQQLELQVQAVQNIFPQIRLLKLSSNIILYASGTCWEEDQSGVSEMDQSKMSAPSTLLHHLDAASFTNWQYSAKDVFKE